MFNFKRIFLKNKNNKFNYYVKTFFKSLIPASYYRNRRDLLLSTISDEDVSYIKSRVDYYNKLHRPVQLSPAAVAIKDYRIPEKIRVYYFDSIEYLRYFDKDHKFEIIPGDVTHIPAHPAIVKSRPIAGDIANSVILNLDKARHFNFVKDDVAFADKKDILVGRSGFQQPHRARFYELYANHPLCDLQKATRKSDQHFLSIAGHLNFKFILALEGNDVATNLKWIMSSNSIAVMAKPTYETWFMEGHLIADYHYICIKDDYSDLPEKLAYYIENTEAALQIVQHAQTYVEQFKNKKREDVIALSVLQKYFELTESTL